MCIYVCISANQGTGYIYINKNTTSTDYVSIENMPQWINAHFLCGSDVVLCIFMCLAVPLQL
jgi:hypothetical protein